MVIATSCVIAIHVCSIKLDLFALRSFANACFSYILRGVTKHVFIIVTAINGPECVVKMTVFSRF